MGTQSFLLMLTVVVLVSVVARIGAQTSRPLACHDPNRVCSAYLYYMLSSNESKADVASLFNVGPHDLTLDPHSTGLNSQGLFIRVNCSCISSIYLASASFNATSSTNLASIITQDYTNLAWPKNTSLTVASGSTVPISLLCGCLDNTREYGYLLSYVVQSQDSLAKLAARFDSSISSMVLLNNITNENVIHDDQVYYLPINIAPLVTPITSASVPDSLPPAVLLSEIMTGTMDVEKPIVYVYEEILNATDNFKDSNLLGQGAFGTVYYGVLRDQEVAIKRMQATITKEFLAEMKVLCKFHHTNLNELFGYASYEDELFLIYEYAEHRAVADRLHEPTSKGFTPLTWNARVQIASDTARGLEYIHEHTKEHYVHRDVKTSNILLDGDFRAKIADFGLAKLVEKTCGGEASVTRIVGTFGYLAPEYSRDGIATSKSDVYAFGVVLFELITGKEAISKSKVAMPTTPERRSLTSIVLRALRDCPNPIQMGRLRELVDPNLMDMFPQDCLYKMAKLGQQCVEEDPILRPDMKYVVFTLSQILLSSVEWEATLAGSSQIFSGLIQGR
eukprot:c20668_g1_i2 orf=357-2045(-)